MFYALRQILIVSKVLLLPDIIINPCGEGRLGDFLALPTSVDDEWDFNCLPDLPAKLDPAHPGHLVIGDHAVKALMGEKFQCL